jgi:hypothetical protein
MLVTCRERVRLFALLELPPDQRSDLSSDHCANRHPADGRRETTLLNLLITMTQLVADIPKRQAPEDPANEQTELPPGLRNHLGGRVPRRGRGCRSEREQLGRGWSAPQISMGLRHHGPGAQEENAQGLDGFESGSFVPPGHASPTYDGQLNVHRRPAGRVRLFSVNGSSALEGPARILSPPRGGARRER